LLRELAERRAPFDALGPPATLFFGGGTPSRLPAAYVAQFVQAAGLAPGSEVSLEANPEDLDPATLKALVQAGVTRLSIGMQTLQPDFARLLNRASTVEQAYAACAAVAAAGFVSWSVDLIFGLPGQTLADLDRDLTALAAIDPPHVALYGLTYEPGTPFERAKNRGTFAPVDDDVWADMVEHIAATQAARGLRRYEISNFARPGHESRHNRLYWRDRPYLGLGPSAHGYHPDGERWSNVADLARWTLDPVGSATSERPSPWQAATDLLVSGLRDLDEGLDLDHLRARTGWAVPRAALDHLARLGLIVHEAPRIRLVGPGLALADGATAHLSDALEPAAAT
jgi:oxygen-independent coproporphyrinogen-3 oxidase